MPRVRISNAISWKRPTGPSRSHLAALATALGLLLWTSGAAAQGLRILTWADYLSPQVVERFQRESGIAVSVDTVSTSQAMVAPLGAAPPAYDVIFPADFQARDLIARNLLERMGVDRLPNFWNVDDVWRSPDYDPRNEYTMPHVWGTTAFVVDTAVWSGPMDSLSLIFDPPPALAGRMAVIDGGFDMVQMTLVWLKLPRCSTAPADMDKVRALLRPLLARVAVLDAAEIVADMIAGRHAVAVIWNGDALRVRRARPSARYANPREGQLVWSDVIAVPRGAANRANAQAFLSFMMRPEIAAMQSNFTGFANMIRGSEPFMDPALLEAPEIITPPSSAQEFFIHCGNGAENRQDEIWRELLAARTKVR